LQQVCGLVVCTPQLWSRETSSFHSPLMCCLPPLIAISAGGRAFILYPMRESSTRTRQADSLFGWSEAPDASEEVKGACDDLERLKKSGVLGPHAKYVDPVCICQVNANPHQQMAHPFAIHLLPACNGSPVLPRLALLHGGMDGPSKHKAVEDLRRGAINVLLCTTVVEVGLGTRSSCAGCGPFPANTTAASLEVPCSLPGTAVCLLCGCRLVWMYLRPPSWWCSMQTGEGVCCAEEGWHAKSYVHVPLHPCLHPTLGTT
jgi:hypothetical protein